MKNILRELILPAFWLFVFIIFPGNESRIDKQKKTDNNKINQQDIPSSGGTGNIKSKEAAITRVALLTVN